MSLPPHIGLIFDFLVIVLLMVTILYSVKLSKLSKLFQHIQDDKKDMETLLAQLSNIIDTANNAIQNMKKAASENGVSLQKNIDEAKDIADELEIILSSGNSLASRLQDLVEESSNAKQKTPPAKKKKKTPAEKMLLDAIGSKKESK